MWIALLITHSLLAFLLLGAITHQTLSVWAPPGPSRAAFWRVPAPFHPAPTSRRLSFYIS